MSHPISRLERHQSMHGVVNTIRYHQMIACCKELQPCSDAKRLWNISKTASTQRRRNSIGNTQRKERIRPAPHESIHHMHKTVPTSTAATARTGSKSVKKAPRTSLDATIARFRTISPKQRSSLRHPPLAVASPPLDGRNAESASTLSAQLAACGCLSGDSGAPVAPG